MVSYKVPDVFSKNNETNDRLFQLLQKAYIGSRYDKNYAIDTDTLVEITNRVVTLKNVMTAYL